jgi:hypothetical protein
MVQRRSRPTKRFRIDRSCARVGIPPRADWLFLCVARSNAKALNTRMVCPGVVSCRYYLRPTAQVAFVEKGAGTGKGIFLTRDMLAPSWQALHASH